MSGLRRLALLVSYDGQAGHGFQRQPGLPTIQEELERAWTALTGERVVVTGSGRTDAGVHARGQVVHLDSAAGLPVNRIVAAMNAWLPEEIALHAAVEVEPGFHARVSAVAKTYLYRLVLSPVRPVLWKGRAAWERHPLDLAAMRGGASHLRGRHDFRAFTAAGGGARSTVRRLHGIHLLPVRDGLLLLFQGEGFLYRMVRNLVGTLLEVGRGRRDPEWVAAVRDSLDRRRAGPTAPAAGLCLWRVHYHPDPFRAFWSQTGNLMLLDRSSPSRRSPGRATPRSPR